MATRPPIQAVIEQAEFDPKRRNWRMALFNSDLTPFSGGGGGGGGAFAEEVADVTLSSGWQNLVTYEHLRRIKQGRLVTIVGTTMASGAKSIGDVIGTIPEGWRPAKDTIGGGFGWIGVGYGISRVDVETDGEIVLQSPLSDADWVSVNVNFLVAEPII